MESSASGFEQLHKDQRRLYEHQNRLTKKIQEKEKTLQEKLLRAEKKLRNIQPKATSGHNVKREERLNDVERMDKSLYYPENGIGVCENTRQRTTGNIRNKVQGEKTREIDWGVSNIDIEQREKCETWIKDIRQDREQDEIVWVKWGRNTDSTIVEKGEQHNCKELGMQGRNNKDVERWEKCEAKKSHIEREGDGIKQNCTVLQKTSDLFEEMKTPKCLTARIKKEIKKREAAYARNETKEKDRRDCLESMVNEQSNGRCMAMSSIENENDNRQDFTDRGKSKSVAKASTMHDKIKANTISKADLSTTQAALCQNGLRVTEEMTSNIIRSLPTKPLCTAAPNPSDLKQKGKKRQNMELHYLQCTLCNRGLTVDRLETHIRISHPKQRAKGIPLEDFFKTNKSNKPAELKNNWRQKHEAFIRSMRQARAPAVRGSQSQSGVDRSPDYVSCPHCNRCFAPGPAYRHIPKCQSMKSKPVHLKQC